MFELIYKFQFNENQLTYLIKSTKKLQRYAILKLVILLVLELIIFKILKDSKILRYGSILVAFIILYLIMSKFKKNIDKLKLSFLKDNNKDINFQFTSFENFRTYNLLNYIMRNNNYIVTKDTFEDLYEQCDNKISSLEHLVSLTPASVLLYSGLIGFFSSIITTLFKEYEEFRIPLISLSLFAIICYFVIKSIDSLIFESNRSTIYKYKSLKIYLKDSEILYKILKNTPKDI